MKSVRSSFAATAVRASSLGSAPMISGVRASSMRMLSASSTSTKNGGRCTGFSLLAFAILLGVYPNFMLNVMHSSMDQLVTSLDTGYQHAIRAAGAAQALLQR